jgi:hypothetical protein
MNSHRRRVLHRGTARWIGESVGRYDAVMVTQTLQFLTDLEAASGSFVRRLRTGGSLLLSVPALLDDLASRLQGRPQVRLFLLWSAARSEEGRILSDIASHFRVLDLIEVTWTRGDTFARNLSRMYGDDLPPHSDKELHCGSGPFLVAVVEDVQPRYRLRRTNRGLRILNSSVFDARRRYRTWTDGGHKVHASDSLAETERNLALLLGERAEQFHDRRAAVEHPARRIEADPVGTDGWASLEQLRLALETHGGRVTRHTDGGRFVRVIAPDVWWIELIAGGSEVVPGIREVSVAGDPMRLILHESLLARRRAMFRRLGHRARTRIRALRRNGPKRHPCR